MKRIQLATLVFLLFFLLRSAAAQTRADTTFKGSTAIAAHLLRMKAPRQGTRPSDLELRLDVTFDLDSYQLKPRAKAQLDTLAKVLKMPEFSAASIELAGHTCDIGRLTYNDTLSMNRVKSAVAYLVSMHGIASDRISQRWYGERLPLIVGANNEQERSVNRRVVVYLPENREALEELLRQMPVADGFRWGVFHYDESGRARLIEYDGSTILHSNDEYRIYLRPARTKYVYLYQVDSKGNANWIFPSETLGMRNPLRAGEYFLPSRNAVFALDNTVGIETLHLVVTDSPAPDLDKIINQRDPKKLGQGVSQTVVVRGLNEVRTAAAPMANDANSQTVEVMTPGEKARANSRETRIDFYQPSREDVLTVMGNHREFYMKLRFGHE